MNDGQVFTGEILSYGKTISNFTLKLSPQKKYIAEGKTTIGALIPVASGAKISGLNVSFTISCDKIKTMGDPETTVSLAVSGVIGKVEGDAATLVKDCNADLTVKSATETAFAASDTAYSYQITVGDLAAIGDATVENCASALHTEELTGTALTVVPRKTAA